MHIGKSATWVVNNLRAQIWVGGGGGGGGSVENLMILLKFVLIGFV